MIRRISDGQSNYSGFSKTKIRKVETSTYDNQSFVSQGYVVKIDDLDTSEVYSQNSHTSIQKVSLTPNSVSQTNVLSYQNQQQS